jgi:hypothetical protein
MGVVIWLLGVVLTLGAAVVGPAEGAKNHHYDFFVSRCNVPYFCVCVDIFANSFMLIYFQTYMLIPNHEI